MGHIHFDVDLHLVTKCECVAAGSLALTAVSWSGLDYSLDAKERSVYFETFLRFIGAFRTLNNYKLRILIGGLFNVDLKVIQVLNTLLRKSLLR